MKFLAKCLSWFLYGCGHTASIPMNRWPKVFSWLYPVYNQLMHWSVVINDKYDLDIWLTRQKKIDIVINSLMDLMDEDDEITIPFIIEMLLKDHDVVYVAMVAKQLQQQLWDQVTLGLEVGKYVEGAVGNRTPGVIFMNPRNGVIPEIVPSDFETVLSVSPDNPVTFKTGRAYRHSGTGKQIRVIGRVETTVHGNALMAEEPTGEYYPVGSDVSAAVNWETIPLSEWMKNFS